MEGVTKLTALAGMRALDLCGCELLAEDTMLALTALRGLTELNVASCLLAVTNKCATAMCPCCLWVVAWQSMQLGGA